MAFPQLKRHSVDNKVDWHDTSRKMILKISIVDISVNFQGAIRVKKYLPARLKVGLAGTRPEVAAYAKSPVAEVEEWWLDENRYLCR